MSSNILITGGAGFTGFHLTKYHQEKGDVIFILDNLFKSSGEVDEELEELSISKNVSVLQIDLTKSINNAQLPEHFDIVYHLAAINGTRLFYEIPYEVARSNLLITVNLLDFLENRTIERLVYSSSSEVYAGCDDFGLLTIPTNEEIPVVFPQPTSVRFSYGTSKFMGEFLCLRFGEKFNVPVTVVRYHNIYGPRMGNKHVIPEFILRLNNDENPLEVYGGNETRAFCYVSDAVAATIAVANEPKCEQEIVHIGNSREEIKIRDLAKKLIDMMGLNVDVKEMQGREASVARRCPDTTKLKYLTDYDAVVNLHQGLSNTIEWYLSKVER